MKKELHDLTIELTKYAKEHSLTDIQFARYYLLIEQGYGLNYNTLDNQEKLAYCGLQFIESYFNGSSTLESLIENIETYSENYPTPESCALGLLADPSNNPYTQPLAHNEQIYNILSTSSGCTLNLSPTFIEEAILDAACSAIKSRGPHGGGGIFDSIILFWLGHPLDNFTPSRSFVVERDAVKDAINSCNRSVIKFDVAGIDEQPLVCYTPPPPVQSILSYFFKG